MERRLADHPGAAVAVNLHIDGPAEQKAVAAKLRREAARFQRRVSGSVNTAVNRVFRPTLVGTAPSFMPSGYAPLIQKDVKVRTITRGSRVTATVSAPTGGTKGGRDVSALERGSLRHPVFARGPSSTWRWVGQRIKPDWAQTSLDATRPQILREIDAELREIARDVEGAV